MTQVDITFTTSLCTDIKDGNHVDATLGHLSEANLSNSQLMETLAQIAEGAATRYDRQAEIVEVSVKGVENLAGSAGYERGKATNLRNLANRFREIGG